MRSSDLVLVGALAAISCSPTTAVPPVSRAEVAKREGVSLRPVVATSALAIALDPAGPWSTGAEPSARLNGTRDIYVRASFPQLRGTHLVRLEVVTPSGDLYTQLFAGVSTLPQGSPTVRTPRLPQPVPVQLVRELGADPSAVLHLPIAGTFIAQYALAGRWRLKAYLDQQPEPASSVTMVLE